MRKPLMIGITSGSGSGKTTVLNAIRSQFKTGEIVVLSQDNYYKDLDLVPLDKEGVHDFDDPLAIDHEAFYRDIRKLMSGETVRLKEYTFNNPEVKPRDLTFRPAPIIIVEGILIFYFEKICDLFDIKIFVEAKENIKISRRIKRDNQERGYDLDDVLYRYQHHVTPVYEKFIKPFRDKADLIIPNNSRYDKAVDIIVAFLQLKLYGK